MLPPCPRSSGKSSFLKREQRIFELSLFLSEQIDNFIVNGNQIDNFCEPLFLGR